MKVIFFGGRHVHSITKSLNENFDLPLVVTTDKSMVDTCNEEGIFYIHTLSFNEKIIKSIKEIDAEIGIVADFGIIIPKEIIDLFPNGIINVHPSLLPKYRGPTPVQSAIINGDKKTGISIIKIDEKMDHGPLLYQEESDIKPTDFTEKLLLELFDRASDILPEIIEHFVNGGIEESPQEDEKATYTKELKKEDGYIDMKKLPSPEKLKLMIRGLNLWPGVWTKFKLGEKEVIIKLLPDNQIQVEGKKAVGFKDFKNGYEKGEEFLKKLGLS